MSRTQTYEQTVVIEDCCTCGGPIAITQAQKTLLQENHGTFHCASGHRNYWPGKSDHDRLVEAQDKLAAAETSVKTLRIQKGQLTAELRKCPCPVKGCGKRVIDLARHQARVHGRN